MSKKNTLRYIKEGRLRLKILIPLIDQNSKLKDNIIKLFN